jgi:hypothetical protein
MVVGRTLPLLDVVGRTLQHDGVLSVARCRRAM